MRRTLLLAAAAWLCLPGIVLSQEISIPIDFTLGSQSASIIIGTHPDASDQFDLDIDKLAPPTPPFGVLYVRSMLDQEELQIDYRDTNEGIKTYSIQYDYDPASGNNIVLTWDHQALAGQGRFEITDDITGTDFGPVDMTASGSFDVSTAGGMLNEGLRITIELGQQSGVSTEEDALLLATSLEQNYPNPFSRQTDIRFLSHAGEHVWLAVFDVLGREVAVLWDKPAAPGWHAVTWDAGNLPNGIYFYQLISESRTEVKKMTLIR